MLRLITKSALLLLTLIVIVCGIYPFCLWVIGQSIFSFQANGSILLGPDNKPVGSKLIAQPFTKDEFFQPRPSAADYDPAASASSSLAASNIKLRDRVVQSLEKIIKNKKENTDVVSELVPGDSVTTSASGLDPHISLENAEYQLDRVVNAWSSRLKRDANDIRQEILQILKANTEASLGGLFGEPFVNVLVINLELNNKYNQ